MPSRSFAQHQVGICTLASPILPGSLLSWFNSVLPWSSVFLVRFCSSSSWKLQLPPWPVPVLFIRDCVLHCRKHLLVSRHFQFLVGRVLPLFCDRLPIFSRAAASPRFPIGFFIPGRRHLRDGGFSCPPPFLTGAPRYPSVGLPWFASSKQFKNNFSGEPGGF